MGAIRVVVSVMLLFPLGIIEVRRGGPFFSLTSAVSLATINLPVDLSSTILFLVYYLVGRVVHAIGCHLGTTVGLTGSIACGKSTVMRCLKKETGCNVVDLDEIGHSLLVPGHAVYKEVVGYFGPKLGPSFVGEDGVLERSLLSDHIFHPDNTAERRMLNRMTHPSKLVSYLHEWHSCSDLSLTNHPPYSVQESKI